MNAVSDRLRDAARRLQAKIDAAFAPRLENTPKRMRQAQSARIDGLKWQRMQAAAMAIADSIEWGSLPGLLAETTTLKAIEGMVSKRLGSNGYYDIHEENEYNDNSEAALALRGLMAARTNPEKEARLKKRATIADLEQKVKFSDIPGFFPTPRPVIDTMIQVAELRPGMVVLEPSAGKGDIADAVREAGAHVICCEIVYDLRAIIEAKGHLLCEEHDFMEARPQAVFDRVLMNPPFEKGQDMLHVRQAYDWLKPGGRLVALMGPSWTFGKNVTQIGFREWFEEVGGRMGDLPEKSFTGKGAFRETGINIKMVVINKQRA